MASQFGKLPTEILDSYADEYLLNLTIFNYGRYVDNKLQERHPKTHKPKNTYESIINERSKYDDELRAVQERETGRNATAESLKKILQIPGIKIERD